MPLWWGSVCWGGAGVKPESWRQATGVEAEAEVDTKVGICTYSPKASRCKWALSNSESSGSGCRDGVWGIEYF